MDNTTGNGMVMRETLIKVKEILDKCACVTSKVTVYKHRYIDLAKNLLELALAEPPRNCDLKSVCADSHRAYLDDDNNWDEWGNPKLSIQDWLLARSKVVPFANCGKHPQRGED